MKIVAIEDFHADAGYRDCSYLKITTDEGLVGWAEFREEHGGKSLGLSRVIHRFAKIALGMDPRNFAYMSMCMHAAIRHSAGGLNHQAIGAIENACMDIAAKATGVPVYGLLGGPFRTSIPAYWTHCGSFRVAKPDFYLKERGEQPFRSLDDFVEIGKRAAAAGFGAVKTNPVFFDGDKPRMFNGGFRIEPGFLDRNITPYEIGAIKDQIAALRQGVGQNVDIMLDVAFSRRVDGNIRLARALEPLGLKWLEIDMLDPDGLAQIRQLGGVPIASLEAAYGIRDYRSYFQRGSVDVGIIDIIWNGLWQSYRVATIADSFETNIAPHNPVGDLGSYTSAHFCAAIPNFSIFEFRYDEAPWASEFMTHPIPFRNGRIELDPSLPGWGTEVNLEAVRARPPKMLPADVGQRSELKDVK